MSKKDFTGTGESIFSSASPRQGSGIVAGVMARDAADSGRVPLDVILSPDSTREEIEAGLVEIKRGQDMSDVAICIAIGRLDYESLWRYEMRELEGENTRVNSSQYRNAKEYFDALADKMGVNPSTMSAYRKGGENWHRYKKQLGLESINFREKGDIGKLVALDKLALLVEEQQVDKATVKKLLQSGKLSEIKELIASAPSGKKDEIDLEPITSESKVSVSRGSIIVDDVVVATLPPEGKHLEKMIVGSIREEVRRQETGLTTLTLEVSPDEEPIFTKDIERLRSIRDRKRRAIILEVDADVDEKGLVAAAQRNVDKFVKEYWSKR